MSGPNVLSKIGAYDTFTRVIEQNLGFFPDIKLDLHGAGHRIQIFDEPGSAPRILFSKRAIARYKCNKDVLNYALAENAPGKLSVGACLLLGRQLLLTNRFVGTAFIAHAFTKIRSEFVPDEKTFEFMLKAVAEDDPSATTTLLHPLAHEIGHLEKSQAIAPPEIHSDAFLETYRINYQEIQPITGHFDYVTCQTDRESPLYLPLLREEVISDWFAVNTILYVNFGRNQNKQINIADVCEALIMFPLIAAFEETCLTEWRSNHHIQQILLATQCRYSLLIDSMRDAAKRMTPKHHALIDQLMLGLNEFYGQTISMIWDATIQFASLSRELFKLTDAEVAKYVSVNVPSDQWFHLHRYLVAILDDAAGYQIYDNNRLAYRRLFDSMATFDTLVIEENGTVRLPRRGKPS